METLKIILELVFLGIKDCMKGVYTLFFGQKYKVCKDMSKTPRSRTSQTTAQSKTAFGIFLQCVAFGLLIWFSIFVFHFVVMQIFHKSVTKLLYPEDDINILRIATIMSIMFSSLWKYPMFFVSRILTFVWYQDIANMTCEDVGIKKRVTQSKSEELSEQLMSAIVQTLFLIQGYMMFMIPVPGWLQDVLSTLNLALLYALYAFEYRWCQKGWTMSRRLSYIECKWPYFVGFGLPLAILTSCVETYIESICVFTILFPVTLITSTSTFNEKLQSFNMPIKFFGLATPVADFIVYRSINIFSKRM